MTKEITVITCQVGFVPRPQTVPGDLAGMQQLVGGLVDRIGLTDGVDLWCNDEGLVHGMSANRVVKDDRGTEWPIMGDFFVAGEEEGETISLTAKQIATWMGRLEDTPIGLVVPGEAAPHPVPDANLHWQDITSGVVRLVNRQPGRAARVYVVEQDGERYVVFWHGQESRDALTFLEGARRKA